VSSALLFRIPTLAIEECCGCLNAYIGEHQAEIKCNECGKVLRTVPASAAEATLTEMELSLAVASELCPHCGSVNLFPGFSKMLAFTCQNCGRGVGSKRYLGVSFRLGG
jgi:hypothetical protein